MLVRSLVGAPLTVDLTAAYKHIGVELARSIQLQAMLQTVQGGVALTPPGAPVPAQTFIPLANLGVYSGDDGINSINEGIRYLEQLPDQDQLALVFETGDSLKGEDIPYLITRLYNGTQGADGILLPTNSVGINTPDRNLVATLVWCCL